MKEVIRKIKCKLGFHSPKEIGRVTYPYEPNKTILAMGCRYCGRKLKQGYLVNTDLLNKPDGFMYTPLQDN